MEFQLNKNSFIVFDLDDTLYQEVDFLISAFKEIACLLNKSDSEKLMDNMYNDYKLGNDVFLKLVNLYPLCGYTKYDLINMYRYHKPNIKLERNADLFMNFLKKNNIPLGVITDGRSVTQRNKIKSLGIKNILNEIVISEEFGSEKPNENNFIHFEKKFPYQQFTYIADNTTKDFIAPYNLGWQLVCVINNGRNIHYQELSRLPENTILISDFRELMSKYEP